MASWSDLDQELNVWRAAGKVPSFWWRDDDTDAPAASLDRLIGLSDRFAAPLHLAVVPAAIDPGLAPRLSRARDVHVLQHGFAHINHEPKGARASEIGQNRDTALQLRDLAEGWRRLQAAGLPNLLPVLVPPWNRVADCTVAELPGLRYRMLSAFDARSQASPLPGLRQVNAHVDPIRWKRGAEFRGVEPTLDALVSHLTQRRLGQVDSTEPTGFLTHHLQTDAATWEFVEALLERLTHRDAGTWVRLSSVLEAR